MLFDAYLVVYCDKYTFVCKYICEYDIYVIYMRIEGFVGEK